LLLLLKPRGIIIPSEEISTAEISHSGLFIPAPLQAATLSSSWLSSPISSRHPERGANAIKRQRNIALLTMDMRGDKSKKGVRKSLLVFQSTVYVL
jgi:hypothetical protein